MNDESKLTLKHEDSSFLLSVVMPVFNEAETLPKTLEAIRSSGVQCQIIIVDDGSEDGTREFIHALRNDPDVTVHFHPVNRGKGASIRTGFESASGDAVVIQDADLEYNPADYQALLAPIQNGTADVVYGSRFMGQKISGQPARRYWGNRTLTWLTNCITGLKLTDMETCYKVLSRPVLEKIVSELQEDRFGIEPEITARIARIADVRIVEVPIQYQARSYREGKKIRPRDGFRAVWCLVKYGLLRR